MKKEYRHIVIGGTFDLLHIGHKHLLTQAFKYGQFVSIGLTTDRFNQKRHKQTVQNQQERLNNLKDFIDTDRNYRKRYKVILIDDIYGQTLVDSSLEAIIVTDETYNAAEGINNLRTQKKLQPLQILKTLHIKDLRGEVISSSRIRDGQINDKGEYIEDFLLKLADKKFADLIRTQLRHPLGKIVTKIDSNITSPIISVGDITTRNLYSQKLIPKLSVIDFKTNRKTVFSILSELGIPKTNPDRTIENPPGLISTELIQTLKEMLNFKENGLVVMVNGEEDLAVLPLLLLSKFNTRIYYGQPGVGMVELIVNMQLKSKVFQILNL